MTMITSQEGGRSRFRPSTVASFIRPAVTLTERLRDMWSRRQTERMLESLPSEVRKDIGWPTPNTATNRK